MITEPDFAPIYLDKLHAEINAAIKEKVVLLASLTHANIKLGNLEKELTEKQNKIIELETIIAAYQPNGDSTA